MLISWLPLQNSSRLSTVALVLWRLTYDDTSVPQHYAWKTDSHLEAIEATFKKALQAAARDAASSLDVSAPKATQVRPLRELLDADGRWISTYTGQVLPGQPKFQIGERFISSDVFTKNLGILSRYVKSLKPSSTRNSKPQ